jgi:hypothetical protein
VLFRSAGWSHLAHPMEQFTIEKNLLAGSSEGGAFFDECFDDSIERLRLLAVTEMAGLIDDVHL